MQKATKVMIILFLLTGSLYYLYVDSSENQNYEPVIVGRVIDGDTIELTDLRKVRLSGINTPEKKSYLSEEVQNFTKQLTNKTVLLEIKETDKYGRILGYVFYENKNINEELIAKGLAHSYYYEKDKYTDKLEFLEKEARESQLGIWKKSPNSNCIEIKEFSYLDLTDEENETLILENFCNFNLDIEIKDDATHIYKKTIYANSELKLVTQNIWNDDKDTIYIWDSEGLILFYRYE